MMTIDDGDDVDDENEDEDLLTQSHFPQRIYEPVVTTQAPTVP